MTETSGTTIPSLSHCTHSLVYSLLSDETDVQVKYYRAMTAAMWTPAEVLQWASEQSLPAAVLGLLKAQRITGTQLLAYLPRQTGP